MLCVQTKLIRYMLCVQSDGSMCFGPRVTDSFSVYWFHDLFHAFGNTFDNRKVSCFAHDYDLFLVEEGAI